MAIRKVKDKLGAAAGVEAEAALDKLGAVTNFSLKGEVQNDMRTKMVYEMRF